MDVPHFLSITEQVAAYLCAELELQEHPSQKVDVQWFNRKLMRLWVSMGGPASGCAAIAGRAAVY
jgi:hypothetical protein